MNTIESNIIKIAGVSIIIEITVLLNDVHTQIIDVIGAKIKKLSDT